MTNPDSVERLLVLISARRIQCIYGLLELLLDNVLLLEAELALDVSLATVELDEVVTLAAVLLDELELLSVLSLDELSLDELLSDWLLAVLELEELVELLELLDELLELQSSAGNPNIRRFSICETTTNSAKVSSRFVNRRELKNSRCAVRFESGPNTISQLALPCRRPSVNNMSFPFPGWVRPVARPHPVSRGR
jgi:hypothetical protein